MLTVLVEGQALGNFHKFFPGVGLVSGGIGFVGSVKHILVVVQNQDFVGAGVANGGFAIFEGDAFHGLEFFAFVHLGNVRHDAVAGEVEHSIFVHHAAIGQLVSDGVVDQGLGVLFVGDLHGLNEDLVLHGVELVQRLLDTLSFRLVAPEGIGDVDASVIGHGSHGDQHHDTQEQSKQFLHEWVPPS